MVTPAEQRAAADKAVAYGVVVKIMADIKKAGFDKLGMITQPEEEE